MDPRLISYPNSYTFSDTPACPISCPKNSPPLKGGFSARIGARVFLSRQQLIDDLARTTFAHLPHSTAKEAQAAWRAADRIAVAVVDELARIVRVEAGRPTPHHGDLA